MKKIGSIIVLIILNLVIPSIYAYDSGREIFVRHINRDTGEIITTLSNANQEVISSEGAQSLLSNSTADDAEIAYSEYYNYDITATMTITKSLVVRADGKNYKYLGANVCTWNSLDEAYTNAEQKKSSFRSGISELDYVYDNSSITSMISTQQSNSNDVTIIDFYYTEQNTTDISPRLLSNTNVWTSNDASLTSDITYVPAGGRVMPYFVTPKYVVKDLSYEKTIEDGRIYYIVNKFNVYVLDNSNLYSTPNIEKNGISISGDLVGNGNKYVFSGLGNIISLPVENNTKTEITNELNTLLSESKTTEIPSNNAIDVVSAEQASADDFTATGFVVNYEQYNGLRSAKGSVVYNEYNVLSNNTTGHTKTEESVNEHFINVYTPIQLAVPEVTVTNASSVNHSNTTSTSVILSDDASFEIKLRCTDNIFERYNNIDDRMRARFVDYYYLIFDFDVVHNGRIYSKGTAIRMTNTAEFRDGYTYFHGTVAPNETLSRDSSNHKIIVLASASNMPSNQLLHDVVDQEVEIQINNSKDPSTRTHLNDSGNNEVSFSNDINTVTSYNNESYTGTKLYADAYYFAMQTVTVRTVSRIYDFKISDCTDLAYKSVFRNVNSATDVNSLTGNNYYSGIRRMFVYTNNNKEYTTLLDRNDIYINGTSSTKTLPLGPYKHTTATYINAPKLGYRIAFDLKTTGYYIASSNGSSSRRIIIKPSYYYLSKDGSTLIKDITLYYKDSTGKYKKFVGSDYTIYFTPNDGYRYKSNSTTSNISSMSTKQEALNIGSSTGEFYITDNMMSSDNTNYIQSWYGEFKLPNTTIAVKNGDNIDNALTDGYIGVKFDITCYDANLNENISYNRNNKTVGSQINTMQWDYEGYLGFSNPGQQVTDQTSLRIQLEKGIWSINTQEMYDFVKGTVLLYDIDSRAAEDIQ